ncbi:unnamed protein product [Cunninghamella blakesleeana]
MKFNLIALSAIALCLLQQVQADTTTGTSIDSVYDQTTPGVTGNTVTSGTGVATPNKEGGLLSELDLGLRKREDLASSLLGTLQLLNKNGNSGILKSLDLGNLGKTLTDLVDNVLKLVIGEDGVLKTVIGLAETVVNLVETLLKEILKLLGVDGSDLGIDELLKTVTDILDQEDGLSLLNGEVLDLEILDELVGEVQDLLEEVQNIVLTSILESVLKVVDGLLSGLDLDALPATKRSALRRSLVKRTIAKHFQKNYAN